MKRERKNIWLLGSGLLLVTAILTGMTLVLPINPWPTVFNFKTQMDQQGIPLSPPKYNLAPVGSAGATDFNNLLNYVLLSIPERVNQSGNKSLFPELQTGGTYDYSRYNVILDQAADMEISFVYEGAGYRNSLGYFTFDPANPPTRTALMTNGTVNKVMVDQIIFPNASLFNSGGSVNGLFTGDTLKISFTAQTLAGYSWNAGKDCTVAGNCKVGVGFVIVADGYQNLLDPITGISTNGAVRPSPSVSAVFYSLRDMNPEVNTITNPDINQHMVLLNVPNTSLYGLAFEDINRSSTGCDHDFNDVVYRLSVNPLVAFTNRNNVYKEALPDADLDGVPDAVDEFKNDDQRASSTWYPSSSKWNTLAFEDLWPNKGDYDMNDLVVNYRYRLILRADGLVKEVEIYYQLMASGASSHDGFGVEFTGILNGVPLDYARLKIGTTLGGGTATNILRDSTTQLMFKIFTDALAEFGGGSLINTQKGSTLRTQKYYQLNVAFTTPVDKTAFTYAAPFNPFLFNRDAPWLEVHLPGYPPTSAADLTNFGKGDDNSSVAAKRYYVSKLGYPWALNIPSGWKWPKEGTDIVTAYPNFKTWAESNGTLQTSWYSTPSSTNYIYP